jgi:hypothetical protein
MYAIKKDVADLCATKKSCSHLCVIVLNFFTLYAIPSNFASNGVKWIEEMTIVPLQS